MIASLIKRSGLALATAMLASAAHAAEPLLRGEVIVNAAIVTVGDLFENAGLMAETAVFRAPAPGTAGVLTLDEVAAAARAAGIDNFEPAGLQTIRVARSGVAVDLPLLTNLIADDLRNRGILSDNMDMEIALDAPLPELVAADTNAPASLSILRYMPGSSTFSARFQISGLDRPFDVSGQIVLMVEAPHLTRTLPQGTILTDRDVEMRMIPLAYAEATGLVAIEQLIGKELQRQTRAGVMLRPSDIASPRIISRNDPVTIVYQHGALTLTTTGKALNAASLSEPVSVLNTMSNKVVQGIATRSGTVTIHSGAQQIAGL